MTANEARTVLENAGCGAAWGIEGNGYEESTIRDIVGKLLTYGSISEKQMKFIGSLLHKIAARALPKTPVPAGRVVVEGVVLNLSDRVNEFGLVHKMIVQASSGYKIWTTVPREWVGGYGRTKVGVGWAVKFTVTVTASQDDPSFGFGSRPSAISAAAPVVVLANAA